MSICRKLLTLIHSEALCCVFSRVLSLALLLPFFVLGPDPISPAPVVTSLSNNMAQLV